MFYGMKKAKFAVCFIFWFELHTMWLDWCQIGSLNVGLFAGEGGKGGEGGLDPWKCGAMG